MKKILSSLFALMLVFTLVACGGQQSKTFVASNSGMDIEATYNYSGDKISTQTTTMKMPYETFFIKSKEDAPKMLDFMVDVYKDIEGIDAKIEYGDTEAVMTLSIDYTKVDFEKIKNGETLGLDSENFDKDKVTSMKETEKMLLENGFTEKK